MSIYGDKRTFKAECLVETMLHKVGQVYNVETFVKEDSWIYVYDKEDYSYRAYTSMFLFQKDFKIV